MKHKVLLYSCSCTMDMLELFNENNYEIYILCTEDDYQPIKKNLENKGILNKYNLFTIKTCPPAIYSNFFILSESK